MKDFKVLYVISNPQRMSGSNRSLFELISNLPKNVKPEVLFLGDGLVKEVYDQNGYKTYLKSPGEAFKEYGKVLLKKSLISKIFILLFQLVPFNLWLWKFIRKNAFQIIHVNDRRGAMLSSLALFFNRDKLIHHYRGVSPFSGVINTIYQSLPAKIITVAKGIESDIEPKYRDKVVTIYNGTRDIYKSGSEIQWLQTLRNNNVVILGCFATITPFKAYHHLIEAISILNSKGYKEKFMIIGVGDIAYENDYYCKYVFDTIEKLGLDNIMFSGWQSDPFIFYRSIDISIMPSIDKGELFIDDKLYQIRGNEGFPRTHLEAMMHSLPIIGTDISGVKEQVIDGVTGFVVEPAAPKQLADAMIKLIENKQMRIDMGSKGRERVLELFSTDRYVAEMMKVYNELIEN